MTRMEPLSLINVGIRIGSRALFSELTLTAKAGECVTVMGPSGCGKSTLLAYVSGALDSSFRAYGQVLVGADDVTALPSEKRRIGIQFQDDLLFPHLTVGGNLAFALDSRVRDKAERRSRVEAALSEAELSGFADRDPATLSGGQRARVALMRTLLAEPRVLLLDEPFNKLDAQLRNDFRRFVFDHAKDRGLPTLLVTHDKADANAAGGVVVQLGGSG